MTDITSWGSSTVEFRTGKSEVLRTNPAWGNILQLDFFLVILWNLQNISSFRENSNRPRESWSITGCYHVSTLDTILDQENSETDISLIRVLSVLSVADKACYTEKWFIDGQALSVSDKINLNVRRLCCWVRTLFFNMHLHFLNLINFRWKCIELKKKDLCGKNCSC